MDSFVITPLADPDRRVEIVERKGVGHPDTICDAVAEDLTRALCREYRDRFGHILHHNVDKALLCGGRSDPVFGGGRMLAPVRMFMGGRAVDTVGSDRVRVHEIAIETARAWFKSNLHAFDSERDLSVQSEIREGSSDLQALFRADGGVPLANDTSCGIGYAPLSELEQLVLAVEREINGRRREHDHPCWGEDIKIMGVRDGPRVDLTVACAMIGRHLERMDDYQAEKLRLAEFIDRVAARFGFPECRVQVNAADSAHSIYLTVTGTSAEAGDDGQVGRGNRANGLITPGRPMSLEAVAGKNPVSHVGKIYNILAQRIAAALVADSEAITHAECRLVSRIGAPVNEPLLVEVRVATPDAISDSLAAGAREMVAHHLSRAPMLADEFISGGLTVF